MDSNKKRDRKVERVTTNNVKTKKKSSIVLFADKLGFIPEDIVDVKDYAIKQYIGPAIRNLISDLIHSIPDILFGNMGYRSDYRRDGTYVSYNNYYGGKGRKNDQSKRGKGIGFNYDDIVFDNRGDVEKVLGAMLDTMNQYGVVSVMDFYEFAGVNDCPYTYQSHGWEDMEDIERARIIRTSTGYIIKLPRPHSFD